MELDWATAVARFVHEAALLLVFGSSLFPFYGVQTERQNGFEHRGIAFLAWLSLFSALCWLTAYLADVSDDPRSLLSVSIWRDLLFETELGKVWSLRICGLVALAVLASLRPATFSSRRSTFIAALSGALLVSLAWLGHSVSAEGPERTVSIVSYGFHVLAAAAWLGGLAPLLQCLGRSTHDVEGTNAQFVLERFSRMGIAAVATIAASGMVNAYLRSVSLDSLLATTYGRVLALKIAAFVLLVGVAACNRWVYLRLLKQGYPAQRPIAALSRSVVLELILGAVVVALAVILALSSPTG
jgi:copper resistance protein D